MLSASGRVWNFSFGSVLAKPIAFHFTIEIAPRTYRVECELSNSAVLFANETNLPIWHSMQERQTMGYNPYKVAQTGIIQAHYDQFDSSVGSYFSDVAHDIVCREIAYFLSFMQRRRVLITNLKFNLPGTFYFNVAASAEDVDATAFGIPSVDFSDSQLVLATYMKWRKHASGEDKKRLNGILVRMNNALNLPYAFERAESYWRILEAAGKRIGDNSASTALYQRLLETLGIQRSPNLNDLVRAIEFAGADQTESSIINARSFRNEITHEFFDFDLLGNTNAIDAMNYLHRACELYVAKEIMLPQKYLSPQTLGAIMGRVW